MTSTTPTLTDRYVQAVLGGIPSGDRPELEREIRALIADTVDSKAAGGTLAVCPDHGTDPHDGTHDAGAVPALRWGRAISPAGPDRMTEAATTGAPVRPAAWPLHGVARLEAAA